MRWMAGIVMLLLLVAPAAAQECAFINEFRIDIRAGQTEVVAPIVLGTRDQRFTFHRRTEGGSMAALTLAVVFIRADGSAGEAPLNLGSIRGDYGNTVIVTAKDLSLRVRSPGNVGGDAQGQWGPCPPS